MSSSRAQIDSQVEVVTPENIAFRYAVAGPFRRFPAYVMDLFLRIAVFLVVAVLLSCAGSLTGTSGLALALLLVFWFVLNWFYGGLFEALFNGQTPGKWMMGVRVLTVGGQPINGLQAVLRNILRTVDMFPLLSLEMFGLPAPAYVIPVFTLGLMTMTFSRRYQRMGDLVCGTMVVIEERQWLTGVARLEDPRIVPLAGYLPADFHVSRSLAQALAAYVERRQFFSADRQREIARHLAEPLLGRFGLPPDTSYDLLLCALYYRAFIADRGEEWHLADGFDPFAPERSGAGAAGSLGGPEANLESPAVQ